MADVVQVNAETGEITERDFTHEELAQREADIALAEAAARAAAEAQAARDAARASAIARFRKLGFTDEEIAELVLPGGA